MTVGELIDALQQFPMNAPVVGHGLDGFDFDLVDSPHMVMIREKKTSCGDFVSAEGHGDAFSAVVVSS